MKRTIVLFLLSVFIFTIFSTICIADINAAATLVVTTESSPEDADLSAVKLGIFVTDATSLPPLNTITCTLKSTPQGNTKWLPEWDFTGNIPLPPAIYFNIDDKSRRGAFSEDKSTVIFSNLNIDPADTKLTTGLWVSSTIGLGKRGNIVTEADYVQCSLIEWDIKNIKGAITQKPIYHNPIGVYEIYNITYIFPESFKLAHSVTYYADIQTIGKQGSKFIGGPRFELTAPTSEKFKFLLIDHYQPFYRLNGVLQNAGIFVSDTLITFPDSIEPRDLPHIIQMWNICIVRRDGATVVAGDYPQLVLTFQTEDKTTGFIGDWNKAMNVQPTATNLDHMNLIPEIIHDTLSLSGTIDMQSKTIPFETIIFNLDNARWIAHKADPLSQDDIPLLLRFDNDPTDYIGEVTQGGHTLTFKKITTTPIANLKFTIINAIGLSYPTADPTEKFTVMTMRIPKYNFERIAPTFKPKAKNDYSIEPPQITMETAAHSSQNGVTVVTFYIDTSKQVTDTLSLQFDCSTTTNCQFMPHFNGHVDREDTTDPPVQPTALFGDKQFEITGTRSGTRIIFHGLPTPARLEPYQLKFSNVYLIRKTVDYDPNEIPKVMVAEPTLNPPLLWTSPDDAFTPESLPTRWTDFQSSAQRLSSIDWLGDRGQTILQLQLNTFFNPIRAPTSNLRCYFGHGDNLKFIQFGPINTPAQIWFNEQLYNGAVSQSGDDVTFNDLPLPTYVGKHIMLRLNNVGIIWQYIQDPKDHIYVECTIPNAFQSFITLELKHQPKSDKLLLEPIWENIIHPTFLHVKQIITINHPNDFTLPAKSIIVTILHDNYYYVVHDPEYEEGASYDPTRLRTPIIRIQTEEFQCTQISNVKIREIKCDGFNIPVDLPIEQLTIQFTNVIIAVIDSTRPIPKPETVTTSISIPDWSSDKAIASMSTLPSATGDYQERDLSPIIIKEDDFTTHIDSTTKQVSFSFTINTENKIIDATSISFVLPSSSKSKFLVHNPQYKQGSTKPLPEVNPIIIIDDKEYTGTINVENTMLQFQLIIPSKRIVKVTFTNVYVINTGNKIHNDDTSNDTHPSILITIDSYGINNISRSLTTTPTQSSDFQEPGKKGGAGKVILIIVLILITIAGVGFAVWWFKFKNKHTEDIGPTLDSADYQIIN